MKPARRTDWRPGDRFRSRAWSEAWPEPLVFEVLAIRRPDITFWAPAIDPAGGTPRRCRIADLNQRVRRYEFVRIWED